MTCRWWYFKKITRNLVYYYITMLEKEIRLPIKWLEHSYEVSNFWMVRSKDRNRKNWVWIITLKWRILKPWFQRHTPTSTAYYYVNLSMPNKIIRKLVHRLVAETFMERVAWKDYVNHIDWNWLNNYISNLEWCTLSENAIHASKTLQKNYYKRKVNKICKDTWLTIETYNSLSEACNQLWLYQASVIRCCKNKHYTSWWFKRSYAI